jgi:hypothetical protein
MELLNGPNLEDLPPYYLIPFGIDEQFTGSWISWRGLRQNYPMRMEA